MIQTRQPPLSKRQRKRAALGDGFVPGAVVAIQTYGDALNPHEHIHMLASDQAWTPDGGSGSTGEVDSEVLTRLFQHQVLEAMVAQRPLTRHFCQRKEGGTQKVQWRGSLVLSQHRESTTQLNA